MVTNRKNFLVIIALIAALSSMFGAIVGGYVVYTVSQRNNSSVTILETVVPVSKKQLKIEAEIQPLLLLATQIFLKPGETVIAIGSPLGDYKNSVTVGVVSATGRAMDTGNN